MAAIHHREQIHNLKIGNAHFAKLFDEYHVINREVIRVEGDGVPVDDASFEELKKQRLHLKDQLYNILKSV